MVLQLLGLILILLLSQLVMEQQLLEQLDRVSPPEFSDPAVIECIRN